MKEPPTGENKKNERKKEEKPKHNKKQAYLTQHDNFSFYDRWRLTHKLADPQNFNFENPITTTTNKYSRRHLKFLEFNKNDCSLQKNINQKKNKH